MSENDYRGHPDFSYEPSEYDAPHGGYDVAPKEWYGDDAQSQSARARDAMNTGSPHIIVPITCVECNQSRTYYGRTDRMPERETFTCDDCHEEDLLTES